MGFLVTSYNEIHPVLSKQVGEFDYYEEPHNVRQEGKYVPLKVWSTSMSVLHQDTVGKFVMTCTHHHFKERIILTRNLCPRSSWSTLMTCDFACFFHLVLLYFFLIEFEVYHSLDLSFYFLFIFFYLNMIRV